MNINGQTLVAVSRLDFFLIKGSAKRREVSIFVRNEFGQELSLDIEYDRMPELIETLQRAYEMARPQDEG